MPDTTYRCRGDVWAEALTCDRGTLVSMGSRPKGCMPDTKQSKRGGIKQKKSMPDPRQGVGLECWDGVKEFMPDGARTTDVG